MIDSMKAIHSRATETRIGCRKRDQATGDGEGSSESKSRPLKYGYVSILGRRRVMEDPVMVMPPRRLPGGYSFFAAYGCSGGAKVAETCTEKLHECLEKHTAAEGLGWGKVVMDCFGSIYEDWSRPPAETTLKFTAAVVALEKGEVVVVNCGGSRAVLWSGGVAVPLGTDSNKVFSSSHSKGLIYFRSGYLRKC